MYARMLYICSYIETCCCQLPMKHVYKIALCLKYFFPNLRVRIGAAEDERELNPNRISALEKSIRNYAERKSDTVVNPIVGTSFDSLEDAYEFYNLYSWEVGFGIRYAKCRLNVHWKKMHARDCLRLCSKHYKYLNCRGKNVQDRVVRKFRSKLTDFLYIYCDETGKSIACKQPVCTLRMPSIDPTTEVRRQRVVHL